MAKTENNFDAIVRRYQEEVRIWTRSWLESNLHKPMPSFDKNGNITSKKGDHFDLWAPKETLQDFAEEIALDYIIPMIEGDLKKKGVKEDWEDLLVPAEDSAQEYIFPVLMKTFRDEAIKLMEKFNSALREIDRDLLGFPKADFSANRIFAAITHEIEGNFIASDSSLPKLAKAAMSKRSKAKKTVTKPATAKKTAAKKSTAKSAAKKSAAKSKKTTRKKTK
jgi:hypothetical protein